MESGLDHENGQVVFSTEGPNDVVDGFRRLSIPIFISVMRQQLAVQGCCGDRGQWERHKYSVTSSMRAWGICRDLEPWYRRLLYIWASRVWRSKAEVELAREPPCLKGMVGEKKLSSDLRGMLYEDAES